MSDAPLELPLDLPIDPDPIEITARALRVRQPIGDLFVANMSYRDLIRVSYFDVRRLVDAERDVERYLGIQRPLIKDRVRDLEQYVNFADASFPTAVIVAVREDYASFDDESGILSIRNYRLEDDRVPSANIRRAAKVIDGQHRIAGLMKFGADGGESVFDVPVTVFIGADIADQAHIFATVNLEQTKVSRSLAYDLYELARTRSPQKTCHNIAVAMNREPEGPLERRIKRLGFATTQDAFQPISQSTFVEGLLDHISADPKADRDALLRGRKLPHVGGKDAERYIFRNMFIDGRDIDIATCVSDYFVAVRERWPDAWGFRGQGRVLNRSMGLRALMRALRPIYLRLASPGDVVRAAAFLSELRKVDLPDTDFSVDDFPPGGSGESKLYRTVARID